MTFNWIFVAFHKLGLLQQQVFEEKRQVFLCIFQKKLSYGYLRFEGNGKILGLEAMPLSLKNLLLKGWLKLRFPYYVDAQFCTNRLFYLALHIWIARSEQDRLTHVYQKWVQNIYNDESMLLQFQKISSKFLFNTYLSELILSSTNTKCLRKYLVKSQKYRKSYAQKIFEPFMLNVNDGEAKVF